MEESEKFVIEEAKRMERARLKERVEEIARMLSGADITAQAIENAKVMPGGQVRFGKWDVRCEVKCEVRVTGLEFRL